MVGNPALREVVGADAFGAVAGAHLGAAVFGHGRVLFVLFGLEQTGAQDFEGFGLVFVLGFFILAGNHNAGGQVGDADGRVCGVYALAAGPGGAEHIHADFFGFDFNIHFLGFGQNGHGHGRGVNAALRFGGRHALHAVGARLKFHVAVNAVAGDEGDDFLVAAHAAFALAHKFHAPAQAFRVAAVHAEQVSGEQGGFVTASAGPDFQNDVLFIQGVAGQEQDFELFFQLGQAFLQGRAFLLGHKPHFRVGVLGQFQVFGQRFFRSLVIPKNIDNFFEVGMGLGQFAITLLVFQHFGLGDLLLQLFKFTFQVFQFGEHFLLQDTSLILNLICLKR